MQKKLHIFKSLEEQEQYHKKLMQQSTVADRFRRLFIMQQMTRLLHSPGDSTRKIQIRKWIS
ncbi:MAG: hypothetical protein HZB42_03770 [Sphingobacteriales bacterium]|nr:hypothetical protein [Sphingobacteriales bacterium]